MTLDDAWYDFTTAELTVRVRSTADNYHFVHDTVHDGYNEDWDFFDYRTAFKTGSETTAEKNYFKNVVRPQIVNNFKVKTILDLQVAPTAESRSIQGGRAVYTTQ